MVIKHLVESIVAGVKIRYAFHLLTVLLQHQLHGADLAAGDHVDGLQQGIGFQHQPQIKGGLIVGICAHGHAGLFIGHQIHKSVLVQHIQRFTDRRAAYAHLFGEPQNIQGFTGGEAA